MRRFFARGTSANFFAFSPTRAAGAAMTYDEVVDGLRAMPMASHVHNALSCAICCVSIFGIIYASFNLPATDENRTSILLVSSAGM